MKRSTLSKMCVAILPCIGLTASLAMADEDKRLSVPVAFGRGLNTAQGRKREAIPRDRWFGRRRTGNRCSAGPMV